MPVPDRLHRDKLTIMGVGLAMRKMIRHLGVMLTVEQHAKIRRATRIERKRRQDSRVQESTLVRELAMAGVEQILATAASQEPVAAAS
jgi:uncharacterized protein YwlG (UPF0340 family)